jgi:tRNA nucleotidyltransferase (CCA-adding enzyme)
MKTYLVGGAVRDKLLGLPVKERDWVVVGGTPAVMQRMGYKAVGKDFPVFLHPKTKEEYALARTERKVSKGYKGFTFYAKKDVTLEEDLRRRDLTINAIAEDEQGNLIDPYSGQQDLKNRILRHVSPAFAEDPVRILRLARFASKLPEFKVHTGTNQLMQQMVKEGEVNALVAERVWQEFERALIEPAPQRFFEVLSNCHALSILFPMIKMNGTGIVRLIDSLSTISSGTQRFAVLCHDISLANLKTLQQRYRIPQEYFDLAKLTINSLINYQNIEKADAETLLQFLKNTDGLRRPKRFKNLLTVLSVCVDDDNAEQRNHLLLNSLIAIKEIDTKKLQDQNLSGPEFAKKLRNLQIEKLKQLIAS